MTKRSHALLVCVAVGVACGGEAAFEPERLPAIPTQPTAFTLTVSPVAADLFSVAPGNWVQLTIEVRNETGALIELLRAATYSSSAPEIADVSNTGFVVAGAPGTAVITASITLGGTTRAVSMTVIVYGNDRSGSYPEVAGVYDLVGVITSSDPVWGIEDGTRQTAVLTIRHSRDSPRFEGTFTDFRAVAPSGEFSSGNPGSVGGNIAPNGLVVFTLTFEGSQSDYWYGVGTLGSGQIVGRYGAGGHISGTFIAVRR